MAMRGPDATGVVRSLSSSLSPGGISTAAGLRSEGRAALARGDLSHVREIAAKLLKAPGGAAESHFLNGIAEAEAGRISAAIPLVAKAAALEPSAEYHAQLARLLIHARRDGEAREAAARAEALGPADALTFDTIGCVYTRLGAHEASLAPFRQAVASEPGNVAFLYNLAAACGFTGRVDEAAAHYAAILAAEPANGRAHYALSILTRQTAAANHVATLEAALAVAAAPDDRLRIEYALAKEHEDLGDAPAAFEHLSRANAQRRLEIGYDFAQDAAIFDALEALFGDPAALRGAGAADAAPIFVIGMPRTGTTLVDRILSSHPAVASAGELQAMPLAVKALTGTPGRHVIDVATIAASGALDPAAIGAAYLARAAAHRPAGATRFVDKLPANMLYAGHIARALPSATIVCLRRNAMDTVWSNYKNLFAAGSAYYFYSYDLMDSARYYARFDRLMSLWRRLFPGRILELDYEALVAEQEQETRRLIAHCGLPWDAACLTPQDNAAAVATPSAAQVRRPVNADAVARWRRHAAALEPVRAWFEAQGITVE
jgi:tetratricopeptide (TPR) repeat protein